MSLILDYDFEATIESEGWTATEAGGSTITRSTNATFPLRGDYGARVDIASAAVAYIEKDFNLTLTSGWVGFWFRLNSLDDALLSYIGTWYNAAGASNGIYVERSGSTYKWVAVARDNVGASTDSSDFGDLILNQWHYIEFYSSWDGTESVATLYIDKVQVASKTNSGDATDIYPTKYRAGAYYSSSTADVNYDIDEIKVGTTRADVAPYSIYPYYYDLETSFASEKWTAVEEASSTVTRGTDGSQPSRGSNGIRYDIIASKDARITKELGYVHSELWVGCWFRLNSMDVGYNMFIVGYINVDRSSSVSLHRDVSNGYRIYATARTSSGNSSSYSSFGGITVGQWHYLELQSTWDSSAAIVKIYVDNVLLVTATKAADGMSFRPDRLIVGTDWASNGATNFDIDEIKIGLTRTAVQQLYETVTQSLTLNQDYGPVDAESVSQTLYLDQIVIGFNGFFVTQALTFNQTVSWTGAITPVVIHNITMIQYVSSWLNDPEIGTVDYSDTFTLDASAFERVIEQSIDFSQEVS